MTVVDLFAGAGGSALGLHRAGWSHLACVDCDPDACTTLQDAGFPAVLADVRALPLLVGLQPDLVWASLPCQAWSLAGRRRGAMDDRNMWPATLDAIDHLQPTWFLAENVPGLVAFRKDCSGEGTPECCPGHYWHGFIVPEIRQRFPWTDWRILNASSYGVPQHRRRVFLVAGPRSVAWPPPTHGAPDDVLQMELFTPRLPWMTVRDVLNLGAWATETNTSGGRAKLSRSANPPACTPVAGGHATGASPASGGTFHGGPDRASDMAFLAGGARRLTPLECAALQAFPPDWPWHGTKASRYRQVGNAVPPPMAEVLGRTVLEAAMFRGPYDSSRCVHR